MSSDDSNDETVLIRSRTSYQAFNERFATYSPTLTSTSQQQQQPFNRQYSSVYKARLDALKSKCLTAFRNNDNDETSTATIIDRIIELKEDTTSFMVGTIVKHCPKKPKINFDTNQLYHESGLSYLGTPYDDVEDNSNDNDDGTGGAVDPPLANTTYCNITDDTVVLEDESGRIELLFDISDKKQQHWKLNLVTGAIMGIKGKIHPGNSLLEVQGIYYPALGPHRTITPPQANENDDEACILLMSGLDCGGNDNNNHHHPTKRHSSTSLKRELLIDYITGYIHSNADSQSISRIIIAGGGCAKPIRPEKAAHSWATSSSSSKKKQDAKEELQQQMKEMTLPIRELDLFLSEVCSNGVPVDYIPGLYDPTNAHWPQRPIHECLVPNANVFVNMLHRTTNPYEACIGDKVLLGSDGLNIFDLRFNLGQIKGDDTRIDAKDEEEDVVAVNAIDALESSLKFSHLVPTGPDSVPTFPFDTNDPFVIKYTPHIYFCGNCDKFETKLIDVQVAEDSDGGDGIVGLTQVRLICVPSFVKTGQVVVLNLKSLECNIVEIDDVVADDNHYEIENDHDEKKIE